MRIAVACLIVRVIILILAVIEVIELITIILLKPMLIKDDSSLPEFHELLLGVLQLDPGVPVSKHCDELDMLVHQEEVIDGIEVILPLCRTPQGLSLGSKVQDILDLPFKIYEE